MSSTTSKPGLLQFSPFLVFVSLFVISAVCCGAGRISPLFSCLVAVIYSFFTFRERMTINQKMYLFVEGAANTTILTMGYMFIFSAAFNHVLQLIGGIDEAIVLGLYCIPSGYLLPGFFALASLFAIAIGSSMGTIVAFMPIGVGLAQQLGIDPALVAGTVVSGAMLGDNLSLISDTTIAATRTTGCTMQEKFRANVTLAIPAFVAALAVLTFINKTQYAWLATPSVMDSLSFMSLLKASPYFLVLALAIAGIDVLAVLLVGIVAAASIGIWLGTFTFQQSTALLLEGFVANQHIQEVFLLSLIVAGLAHIVERNGGIQYLLDQFGQHMNSKGSAELFISIKVFLITAVVGINTVAILVTGPLANHIADEFKISRARVASLLDIFSCICKGVLPYAPQLLLAGSLAGVSSISILPHLHYLWFVTVVTLFSIAWRFLDHKEAAPQKA